MPFLHNFLLLSSFKSLKVVKPFQETVWLCHKRCHGLKVQKCKEFLQDLGWNHPSNLNSSHIKSKFSSLINSFPAQIKAICKRRRKSLLIHSKARIQQVTQQRFLQFYHLLTIFQRTLIKRLHTCFEETFLKFLNFWKDIDESQVWISQIWPP